MRYNIALALVLVVLAYPSDATGCPSPAGVVAIIHDAAPSRVPEETLVLDVVFEDGPAVPRGLVEARIRRVVHGTFSGRSVLVRADRPTSCHYPFSNGRSGLIVGHLREMDSTQVLHPIYVPRRTGFRLLR